LTDQSPSNMKVFEIKRDIFNVGKKNILTLIYYFSIQVSIQDNTKGWWFMPVKISALFPKLQKCDCNYHKMLTYTEVKIKSNLD